MPPPTSYTTPLLIWPGAHAFSGTVTPNLAQVTGTFTNVRAITLADGFQVSNARANPTSNPAADSDSVASRLRC